MRPPVCAESGQPTDLLQGISDECASLHDSLRVKSTLYPLCLSSQGACDPKYGNKYIGLPRCFSLRNLKYFKTESVLIPLGQVGKLRHGEAKGSVCVY